MENDDHPQDEELAEYTRRTQELSSQFHYVDTMWSTLSVHMIFHKPPNSLNLYMCRTTYAEWLRHIYMFYSCLVNYLRVFRFGKAMELGTYLLICLRRMDSVYRPSMQYYVPKFTNWSNILCSNVLKHRQPLQNTHKRRLGPRFDQGQGQGQGQGQNVSRFADQQEEYVDETAHGHAAGQSILQAQELLESTFQELQDICMYVYGDELNGLYADWTDTTFDPITGATHSRFETFEFVV